MHAWITMGPGHIAGRAILLVEDEPLIALDVTDSLQRAGGTVLAARTLQDGLSLAEHSQLAVAIVVDLSLGSDDATASCERLAEREIPFMFYSGLTREFPEWPQAPFVSKPVFGKVNRLGSFGPARQPSAATKRGNRARWSIARRPSMNAFELISNAVHGCESRVTSREPA
jgi:CheY-like chemotaxis protein